MERHPERDDHGHHRQDDERLHATASRKTSDRRRRAKLNSLRRPAAIAALSTTSPSVDSSRTRRASPPLTSDSLTPASVLAHAASRSPSTRTTNLRGPLVARSSTRPLVTSLPWSMI